MSPEQESQWSWHTLTTSKNGAPRHKWRGERLLRPRRMDHRNDLLGPVEWWDEIATIYQRAHERFEQIRSLVE